jgi:signal transduction histidine kinase
MEALPSAGEAGRAQTGIAATRAANDVSYVHSAAVTESATLELVSGVVAALRAGDRDAALGRLRDEGIEADLADGRLELHSPVTPELEAALGAVFALAVDELALLPGGRQAALGELAAEVAHEMNNPLFAILGLTELLLRDAEPGTKAHERLTLVEQTGLELKELVRALLTFAREPTDETETLSLNAVVSDALDLVRHTSASKGVEIVEHLADGDAVVTGNRNQLKQVLLNVVTNARHASADGGSIAVTVATDANRATVRVSDTGPGIEPALRVRIFEPFFSTKGERGTGLGLPVSRTIARLHGGDLRLEAGESAGATFVLELPLAAREAA